MAEGEDQTQASPAVTQPWPHHHLVVANEVQGWVVMSCFCGEIVVKQVLLDCLNAFIDHAIEDVVERGLKQFQDSSKFDQDLEQQQEGGAAS